MDLLNFNPNGLGFWALVGLAIGLWAVFHIIGSRAKPISKAIWSLIVLLGNWVGLVLWFFFGPREGRR